MTNLNQLNYFSVREGFWGTCHFHIEAQKTRIVTLGQDIDTIDADGNV